MFKRTIIQSALVQEGLVIKLDDQASPEQIKLAILAELPPGLVTADLEIFDEADDDVATRQFADSEELKRGQVLHVGRCRLVETVIRYAGRIVQHRFVPATRIGRVRRWAVHHLEINAADANELILQVAGTSIQPGRDQHVGSYVEAGACVATFDLVRAYTINGDATLTQGHKALEAHLEMAPYFTGEVNGRWRLRGVDWPFALFDVFAKDGRAYTLRLECEGYPGAYFSDRGRLFQSDRGRRNGIEKDAPGRRTSTGFECSSIVHDQRETLSFETDVGAGLGLI